MVDLNKIVAKVATKYNISTEKAWQILKNLKESDNDE